MSDTDNFSVNYPFKADYTERWMVKRSVRCVNVCVAALQALENTCRYVAPANAGAAVYLRPVFLQNLHDVVVRSFCCHMERRHEAAQKSGR